MSFVRSIARRAHHALRKDSPSRRAWYFGRRPYFELLEERRLLAVTWDGGAGTMNWDDAANWSTDSLPGSADDVIIPDLTGSPTISSSGAASIRSLVSDELLAILAGTFSVAEASSLNTGLTISAGTLTGSGDITVGGTFNWGGGGMSGSGQTTIGAGGVLEIYNNTGPQLNRLLTNNGTINMWGGAILMTNGTLQNNGTFNAAYGARATGVSGTNAFNNAGSFNKLGLDAGTSYFSNLPFNNTGSVDVQAGTLALADGGTHTGDFTGASGAALQFIGGTHSFAADSDITGAMDVRFGGGTATDNGSINVTGGLILDSPNGTFTFSGPVSASSLTLGRVSHDGGTAVFNNSLNVPSGIINGGTLSGSADWVVTGNLDWGGGGMSGSGQTTIASGGVLGIYNNTGYQLNRLLTNNGTINMWGGAILMTNGTLQNNGTFNAAYGARATGVSGTNAFNNAGSFNKLGLDAGTSYFSNLPFNNTGSVDVQAGTLAITNLVPLNSDAFIFSQPAGNVNIGSHAFGNTTNSKYFALQGNTTLNGSGSSSAPIYFEVMGKDVGGIGSGFNNNFVFGTLSISSGYARLVDQADNSSGSGPEALYVNTLVVPAGNNLDLNGLHVYARTTQINGTIIGGTVTLVPDGGAISVNYYAPGRISTVGQVDEWTFFGRAGQDVAVVLNPGSTTAPAAPAPNLNFGHVELVDAGNNVIASADSPASGVIFYVVAEDLPADGTYRVRVEAAPSQPSSTGYYTLAVYDAPVDVFPLTLNKESFGTVDNAFAADRWTFAANANQQVRLDLISVSNPTIKFRLDGPEGYTAFSGLSADSALFTLPSPGYYVLTADAPGGRAGNYAFRLEEVSQTVLTSGVSYNGTLPGSGAVQLFKIHLDDPQQLLLSLDDQSVNNRNELYVKFGSPPTRIDYQYKFTTPASADQQLLVPIAQAGDWYILLYGESVPSPSSYSFLATAGDIFATHVTPDQGAANTVLTLTVTGAGFDPSTSIKLVDPENTVYVPSNIFANSTTQISAIFDPGVCPAGTYSLVAEKPGGQTATLTDAITLVASGVPKLETRLILPAVLGRHESATLYVEYANTGTSAMPAPLLLLESSDADNSDRPLLTLDQSRVVPGFWASATPDGFANSTPDGFANSVQILASGQTSGVLQVGESIRIPVYYVGLRHPWNFTDNAIEFALRSFTVDESALIDWDAIKPDLRPSNISAEAWDAVWSNLIAQVGDTWGDYVRMIADNARYLGQLGRSVNDVAELLGFEVQQAAGLPVLSALGAAVDLSLPVPGEVALGFGRVFNSTLADRYRQGPLGRGWSHNWQTTLTVLSNGTVVITDGSGGERRYQPDSRSSNRFFSKAGDSSIVVNLGGGVYERVSLDGQVIRFRQDGKIDYVQDTNGNRITGNYSGALLTSLVHSSGASITIGYNAADLINLVSDSAGRQVHYNYDLANEHLISVQGYDGYSTQYAYDTSGPSAIRHALLSIADSADIHQFFGYDAAGRLTSINLDGDAEHVDITYDSAGKVTINDGAGIARLWFDHQNATARIEDPYGLATYLAYCACGHVTTASNSAGQNLNYTLKDGLVTSVSDPLGGVQQFSYGPLATLLSATDKNGNQTQYSYDARGNLLTTTYADGSHELRTYDVAGNLLSFTNRRNQTINYTYNAAGQLTQKSMPGGVVIDYGYDTRGNLTSTNDSSGTTTYQYDAADRLIHVAYPSGRFLNYTYDTAGRRTRLEDHTGEATNYEYDAAGRLHRLTDANTSLIAEYTYDAAGRLSRKDLGNGTYTTYEYDAAGNVLHLINYAPDNFVNSRFDYTYDILGRRVSMSTLEGDWSYAYDALGQLTRAVFTSLSPVTLPHQDLQYEYDAAGNRVRTIENGITVDYTANNLNQYQAVGSTSNLYDLDGNLVSSTTGGETTLYAYDIENRLKSVISPSGTWVYEYDPIGHRIATIQNGNRTDYLIDSLGLGYVIAEYDGAGVLAGKYAYGLGLTSKTDVTGEVHFYNFDALGSTAGITNQAGVEINNYSYLPFGQTQAATESVGNDFEFLGSLGVMSEDNGLTFMRARFYVGDWGGFTSVDPRHLAGSHLHIYANNDPIDFVDPSGLCYDDTKNEDSDNDGNFKRGSESAPVAGGYLTSVVAIADPCPCDRFQRGLESAPVTGGYLTAAGHSNRADPCGDEPSPDFSPGSTPSPNGGSSGGGGSVGSPYSTDPNQKLGTGFGSAGYVAEDALLPYRIDFENDAAATAPAQQVTITDQLSTDFDWTTFELKEIGFGDNQIAVPAGSQFFHTVVPMTYNDRTFNVEIEVGLHSDTGQVFAQFLSIDPITQLPPNVLTGFLPPEDGTGRGMGFISYVIRPRAGLATGVEIRNVALISFDRQKTIATNQVDPHDPSAGTDPAKEALNTIDAGGPISSVSPLPATSYRTFSVSWSGADDVGGSGIASFDIYVSVDGGEYALWLDDATGLSAQYSGSVGHTYAFYSVASDNVAHREIAPTTADSFTVIEVEPGDYNSDGRIDGADFDVWRSTFGEPGINLAADGNGDGIIDAADYVIWKKRDRSIVVLLPGQGSAGDGLVSSVSSATNSASDLPTVEPPVPADYETPLEIASVSLAATVAYSPDTPLSAPSSATFTPTETNVETVAAPNFPLPEIAIEPVSFSTVPLAANNDAVPVAASNVSAFRTVVADEVLPAVTAREETITTNMRPVAPAATISQDVMARIHALDAFGQPFSFTTERQIQTGPLGTRTARPGFELTTASLPRRENDIAKHRMQRGLVANRDRWANPHFDKLLLSATVPLIDDESDSEFAPARTVRGHEKLNYAAIDSVFSDIGRNSSRHHSARTPIAVS